MHRDIARRAFQFRGRRSPRERVAFGTRQLAVNYAIEAWVTGLSLSVMLKGRHVFHRPPLERVLE